MRSISWINPAVVTRTAVHILAASLLLGIASAAHSQPLYVIGNFCSTCEATSPANQLYDDGLHRDGAAGDGVWGADIVSDRSAGSYYFYFGSAFRDIQFPITQPCAPVAAWLWTSGPGETIHFQFGGAHPAEVGVLGTWFPEWAGSSDHSIPAGAVVDFVLFGTGVPAGGFKVRATKVGSIWSALWRSPGWPYDSAGGTYFVLATPGQRFHQSYNGGCFWETLEVPVYWHAPAGQTVLFEFDEATGQFRNTTLGPTPGRRSTWGEVKAHYR